MKKAIGGLVVWIIVWAAYHDTMREFEELKLISRMSDPLDWFVLDPLARWVVAR